jgi:integrase
MGRPRKLFSATFGEVGQTVTLCERRLGGPLWIRYWVRGRDGTRGKPKWVGLHHSDRALGEKTAREVAAQLLTSTLAAAARRTTVAEVLAAYECDVCEHLKGYGPRESKRRIALWTQVLGASRNVDTIDVPLLDGFVRDRRAGTIVLANYEIGKKPGNRAIAADLEFLRAALNHACTAKRPNGGALLAANPMGYGKTAYKLPRVPDDEKKRPVVSFDRFEKILAKADGIDAQRLFGGFMMLVEGLGWRVSAIAALRACDVDLKASPAAPHGRIHRRAETDKMGRDRWIPMSPTVRAAIDRIRAVNPAIGEWPLFPAPRAKEEHERGKIPKAWTRHYARALLERAERAAKLPKIDGGDFHPYRRKWATERKHLPDVDVARAGGWSEKDPRALKTSYQQVDDATLLAVVSEPTKLREAKPDAETA